MCTDQWLSCSRARGCSGSATLKGAAAVLAREISRFCLASNRDCHVGTRAHGVRELARDRPDNHPRAVRAGCASGMLQGVFCEGGNHLWGMSWVKHGRGSKEPHDCMFGPTDACMPTQEATTCLGPSRHILSAWLLACMAAVSEAMHRTRTTVAGTTRRLISAPCRGSRHARFAAPPCPKGPKALKALKPPCRPGTLL